jgi:hypothetical protein
MQQKGWRNKKPKMHACSRSSKAGPAGSKGDTRYENSDGSWWMLGSCYPSHLAFLTGELFHVEKCDINSSNDNSGGNCDWMHEVECYCRS